MNSALARMRLRAVVLSASMLVAVTASARPEFPDILADYLEMPCSPPCTICHKNLAGGWDSVTKPFGLKLLGLKEHRADGSDKNSLVPALDEVRREEQAAGQIDPDAG